MLCEVLLNVHVLQVDLGVYIKEVWEMVLWWQ